MRYLWGWHRGTSGSGDTQGVTSHAALREALVAEAEDAAAVAVAAAVEEAAAAAPSTVADQVGERASEITRAPWTQEEDELLVQEQACPFPPTPGGGRARQICAA